MKKYALQFRLAMASLFLLLTSAAQAGTATTSITFAPVVLPPPAAPDADAISPAVPVPLLNDLMMVVLGLFLAAIAVRILRKSEAGEKILGVALLCGGLALGTFGARNAEAIIAELLIEDPDCGSTAIIGYDPGNREMPPVKNSCDETYEVTDKDDVFVGECDILVEGDCTIGTTLETGEMCTPDYIEPNDRCEA
ncbi:midcut-by-XrtH protein [Halioglobus maricola]|uniref:Midcut-by-XrtH protein n=1 Tax=Halioglobus maricola TaxID=2601894 RepID=A0A5P9NGB7_9GAMM|nr:midcut-by-XrtH protein [Halioglobus maricola]QFU74850.1 midcut-by-XrtH protein [Halioglobus maricola]